MKQIPEIYNLVYYFPIPHNNWKGFNSSMKIKYTIVIQILFVTKVTNIPFTITSYIFSCMEFLLQILISMAVNQVHLAWWPQHELFKARVCSKELHNLSTVMKLCQRPHKLQEHFFFLSYPMPNHFLLK